MVAVLVFFVCFSLSDSVIWNFVLVFQLVFASVDWFFVALAQIHKWKHAPNKCKTKRGEKKRQIKYCCRRRALHKNTHSIAKSTDFSWTKIFFLLNKKNQLISWYFICMHGAWFWIHDLKKQTQVHVQRIYKQILWTFSQWIRCRVCYFVNIYARFMTRILFERNNKDTFVNSIWSI